MNVIDRRQDANKEQSITFDKRLIHQGRFGRPVKDVKTDSDHHNRCAAASLQVLVPKRAEFKGKMIEVDIYETGKHFMKGRPVEDSKPFTPSIAAPLQKGEVSGLAQVKAHTHTQTLNWKPHLLWY